MRARLAFLIIIGMLILFVALVMAALGRGEYEPPGTDEGAVAGLSAPGHGGAG